MEFTSLLPRVFDLETGKTHVGTTALELSARQGRDIAGSYVRDKTETTFGTH